MTGCGTLASQLALGVYPGHGSPKPAIYGGIRMDAKWIADRFEASDASLALTPFIILDMLPSALADTLLLPWTVAEERRRGARKRGLEEHLETFQEESIERHQRLREQREHGEANTKVELPAAGRHRLRPAPAVGHGSGDGRACLCG